VPAIVGSNAQQDIAAIAGESIREEFGSSGDVEFRILAVSAWSATTFFTGDLHQTLLSTSTNNIRIATTLLHSERNQDDGRNTILVAVLLKDPKKSRAGLERARGGLESRGQ